MLRSLLLIPTLWCAVPTLAALACERPGTPTNLAAIARSSTSIEVRFRNTAGNDEQVGWDFDVANMPFDREGKDGNFKRFPQRAGLPPLVKGTNVPVTNTFTVEPGEQRCFRVKARLTSNGCISRDWSNEGCAKTSGPVKALGKDRWYTGVFSCKLAGSTETLSVSVSLGKSATARLSSWGGAATGTDFFERAGYVHFYVEAPAGGRAMVQLLYKEHPRGSVAAKVGLIDGKFVFGGKSWPMTCTR